MSWATRTIEALAAGEIAQCRPRGGLNGWVGRAAIYGVVVAVED